MLILSRKGAPDQRVANLEPKLTGLIATANILLPASCVLNKDKLCTDVRLMENYPRDDVSDQPRRKTTSSLK